ncbi:MAG: hypothetical protein AABZ06_12025 [Bdellovibrionota bacterium]
MKFNNFPVVCLILVAQLVYGGQVFAAQDEPKQSVTPEIMSFDELTKSVDDLRAEKSRSVEKIKSKEGDEKLKRVRQSLYNLESLSLEEMKQKYGENAIKQTLVPMLIDILDKSEPGAYREFSVVRSNAAGVLAKIGLPLAKPAIDALLRTVNYDESKSFYLIRKSSANALDVISRQLAGNSTPDNIKLLREKIQPGLMAAAKAQNKTISARIWDAVGLSISVALSGAGDVLLLDKLLKEFSALPTLPNDDPKKKIVSFYRVLIENMRETCLSLFNSSGQYYESKIATNEEKKAARVVCLEKVLPLFKEEMVKNPDEKSRRHEIASSSEKKLLEALSMNQAADVIRSTGGVSGAKHADDAKVSTSIEAAGPRRQELQGEGRASGPDVKDDAGVAAPAK